MNRIEERYGCSLWYAWGRIDSGQYGDQLNLEDGFRFAREQKEAARKFYQEEVSMLPSILDAWVEYVKGKLGG